MKGELPLPLLGEKAQKIVGSNPADGRRYADFYPTPVWAVEKLLEFETFEGNIWECACGTGHISKVFMNRGYDVYSTDLVDYGFGIPDVNFLINNSLFGEYHKPHDNIITNPPFDKAMDFLRVAKLYSRDKIAFFLKTQFLEGVGRYDMWKDKEFPFKKMYQFVRRVSFEKPDGEQHNGGMLSFAWFVWEKGYSGNPEIDWII